MVEWKKLGEVCKVHTGSQLNKADMLENGPYPVVNELTDKVAPFREGLHKLTLL